MAVDVQAVSRPLSAGRPGVLRRVLAFVERHPVWTVFLLALAVRVVVVAGLAIIHPSGVAPDGERYSWMAAQVAAGKDAHWDPYYSNLYRQDEAFLMPLTWVYGLFGAHDVLGQLYVALIGSVTAVFALGVGLQVLPRRWALAVGVIVAFLPTQVIWSSLVLKDAFVWFALSGLALTVAVASRSRGPRLIALGLIAAGFLVMLGYLRYQTLIVAAWALMLAALFGVRRQWLRRVAGAIALGVLVPWLVFNLGPAGLRYAVNYYAPSYLRAKQAETAGSAIATPDSASNPAPSSLGGSDEIKADIAHLPTGVSAMLVQPYPWRSSTSTYLTLAKVAEIVWYPLILLGLLGLITLRPRHLGAMAFPLLAGGVILILYALTEGSLGTAIRHRGEFEWVIALLAGFGLMRAAAWRSRRAATRREPAPA